MFIDCWFRCNPLLGSPLLCVELTLPHLSPLSARSGENVIVEAQHTLYVDPSPKHINVGMNPPQSLMPVSVGVTDHHYLVLRPGQLQMLSCLSGIAVALIGL